MIVTRESDIGEVVRRRRLALGLSQTQLAEQAATTRQWVSRLEQGRGDVTVSRLLAILDVLCDLIHIVYGERAAYGIFTPPRSTRAAINAYLDGYLPEENVRIRDKPI